MDERREHQGRAGIQRRSGGGGRQRVERGHGVGELRCAHEERELSIYKVRPLRVAVRVAIGIAAVDDGESSLHLRWVGQAGFGGIGGRRQLRKLLAQGRVGRIAAAVNGLLHLLHGGDDARDGGRDLRVGDAGLGRGGGEHIGHLVYGEAGGRDGLGALQEGKRGGRGGEDIGDSRWSDGLHVGQAESEDLYEGGDAVDQAEVGEGTMVIS